MRAQSAMTRDVTCIAPADDLDAAWALMVRLAIRHLPVLDGETLVGILSDRDVLVHAQLDEEDALEVPAIPVSSAMTARPVTCTPEARVSEVAGLMLDHKIDCLPVVDEHGNMVGLITSSDLLELLRTREEAGDRALPFRWRVHPNALRTVA
ncbi:MAG: CBS domain-containing protein [Deltaproteobacteria bacterium]|nr:CBS domain-containing protein [Deltaproteobacteria bacterium]